jgi:hypothetical protein
VFDVSHTGRRDRPHIFIAGIDYDFIKDFVESWIEVKLAPHHFIGSGIVHPTRFFIGFGAADVGVREFQDVLVMGVFLILANGSHGERVPF